jgi:hypothetical protein
MNAYFWLILGCLGLSATVTYAWWSNLRVWFLRQDLFTIRDELWDAMRARGMLDSSAHRECRESINAIIRLAQFLSLSTVFRLFTIEVDRRESSPDSMPPEVLEARKRVFRRICRYLLFESLTGWFFVLWTISSTSFQSTKDWIKLIVQKIFDSGETQALSQIEVPQPVAH